MGRVWRAHDELLDRLVAVKELLPSTGLPVADRRTGQVSMMREARAAARLQHPAVVRIYDVVHATGRVWIVMEYVESQSLQQRVLRDGPLSHQEAAGFGLSVLRALRAAHAAGVVHHDVKPANVLLAVDGRVMLTDFGLATLDAVPAGDGTVTAPLLGSPHYVAPERLRGGASSRVHSDLWSLGATLYTAVEGRPPFERSSVAESLAAALAEDPDPPRHSGPLHPVIAALMVRDPAGRATAAQTEDALQAVAHRAVGVFAVPAPRRPGDNKPRYRPAVVAAPVTAAPSQVSLLYAQDKPAHSGIRQRPRRKLIVAGSVAAVVLAASGAVVAQSLGSGHHGVARPSNAAQPAGTMAAASISACQPAERQPLNTIPPPAGAPVIPGGWLWHGDETGFTLAAPRDWVRSERAGLVCIGASDGSATFTFGSLSGSRSDPLRHWQAAEQAALADGTLPGYQKVAMGVLLVTGGGADWEYSWQPAAGPRLHTRRVLLSATAPRAVELSWTTRESDWTTDLRTQRSVVASFSDGSSTTPTWAVTAP